MKGNIQVQTRKIDSLLYSIGTPTLYVYKGTMPTDVMTFTLASQSSNLLLTYVMVSNFLARDASNTQKVYMKTYPNAVSASGSGTATWFCMYNNSTRYFIGDTSDVNGTGILKFYSNIITSGTSYDIYSFAFELKQ